MRKLTRSSKKKENLSPPTQELFKVKFSGIQDKITFRCDTFLLEKIKNTLASQHLAGNYQYPNVSYFFRSALHAYQHGMALTYQRELNNPRKEVSFRITEDLMIFYNALPMNSRTEIMERALGSYYYRSLG
jgi:hypothetical protein